MTFDHQQIWVVGAAYYWGSGSTVQRCLSIWDGGPYQIGTIQCGLRIDASGYVYVYRAGSTTDGTQLGTTAQIPNFQYNKWYYVEFYLKIDNSAGVAKVAVNGTTICNFTSQDTQNTANAYANTVQVGGAADDGGGLTYMDDIYMCDGQTGAGSNPCNDFLGDIRVDAVFPNGNGNSSQFVGSDGNSTDNYLLVDESSTTWPNDDTDYVESGTVGNKDTYAFGNLASASGTVFGVQVLPYVKKTDAGARKICSVARLSGTEVDSADKDILTSYQYHPDIRETKPGGGDWTISDFNSTEFGVKVTV